MPEIKNNFIQGKMNKDLDDRLLPNGQYRDAQNIVVSKSESSNVGAVQNVKGNAYAYSSTLNTPQSSPPAENPDEEIFKLWDTIGYYSNSLTGDVFWFVTSFTGATSDDVLNYKAAVDVVVPHLKTDHDDDTTGHRMVVIEDFSNYDIQVGMKVTGTNVAANSYVQSVTQTSAQITANDASVVLNVPQASQAAFDSSQLTFSHTCRIYHFNAIENTNASVIIDCKKLNFSKIHQIHHVNLLGNLLFWTDNYNQPRRINIDQAISGTLYDGGDSDPFFEDKISVAQFAPFAAPKVTMSKETQTDVPSLHLRDKFVKFGYRYVYQNNEVSLISPFTQTCFIPGKNKNANFGSFKTGEAGMLTSDEQAAVIKATTVDSMQNNVNRIKLFIDLPSDENKPNIASADAGVIDSSITHDAHLVGAAQSNQTIHSIGVPSGSAAGVIDNTCTVVTERGDQYTVHSITENANLALNSTITFNEIIPATTPILHGERLFFFKNITNYDNPLKIKKIEIVYAESDSPAVKIVETIEIEGASLSGANSIIKFRAEVGTAATAKLKYGVNYTYDSTKPIKTIPEQDITRVADIVPLKAQAQEVSGNRLIYGNFKINRPISNLVNEKSKFSVTSRDQSEYNSQYLLHSIKQAREYSLGLVLSDRYGRQSTVFLPTANTTYVSPKSTEDTGSGASPVMPMGSVGSFTNANRWNGTALNFDFGTTITDVYDVNTNPYGWYSYKVVVKQSQQEYDNVYVPGLIDATPTNDKSSWITLFGDNINKVPRDVIDNGIENEIASSKTKLLPRILNADATGLATGLIGSGYKQQNTQDFVEIIALGQSDQFGTASGEIGANTNIVNKSRKPLLAEVPDGFGAGSSGAASSLAVFETDPFISNLDIYFETSTAGLISDLNEAITAVLGSVPAGINLSANTFAENIAHNTQIASLSYTDSGGGSPSGESYELISVTDGSSSDRFSEFVIAGSSLKTANTPAHVGHLFRNQPRDTFTFVIKVTDASNQTHQESKTITLTNVTPAWVLPSASINVPDNTTTGTTLATYTGVNGGGNTSLQTAGLSWTISAGNSDGKFGITGSTGELTATDDQWTSGDSYTLTIRLTDAGGLFLERNVTMNIISATVTRFWRTDGKSTRNLACAASTGTQMWHDGSSDLPTGGDKVYTNNTGTTLFNGSNLFYGASSSPEPPGDVSYTVRIQTNGVADSPQICAQ